MREYIAKTTGAHARISAIILSHSFAIRRESSMEERRIIVFFSSMFFDIDSPIAFLSKLKKKKKKGLDRNSVRRTFETFDPIES